MKNLFQPNSAAEIKARIQQLRPDSQRQWGAMTVAQMLAHNSAWMEMAAGLINPPHSFLGPMSPLEWATMGYKHLDHHLQQFGV